MADITGYNRSETVPASGAAIPKKYHDNGDGTYSEQVYGGGGSSAATIADGADVTQGAKADSAASTDTGTFSLIALVKRGLQSLTTIIARLTGAANINAGQATAGSASAELVAARATRRSVLLRNTDASASCYVGEGTVTSGNGFLLKAGESVSIDTTAAVNGIRATTDTVVAYLEVYD